MAEGKVKEKSYEFAVRIVKLFKELKKKNGVNPIFDQLLKRGTSIGANIAEGQKAQGRGDFASKMHIALKEASETDYWLRLMYDTDYIERGEYEELIKLCEELLKMLTAIVMRMKDTEKKTNN